MIWFFVYVTVGLYLHKQWMPQLVKLEPTPIPIDAIPSAAAFIWVVVMMKGLNG